MDNTFNEIITIQFAMFQEAQPLIKLLKAQEMKDQEKVYQFKFYQSENIIIGLAGQDQQHQVDLVSTVTAALLSERMISTFRPKFHINAGTAGGFQKQNTKIGDVFLGTELIYHHRNIELPGFKEMALGKYKTYQINGLQHLKRGIVSTGDSLNVKEDELIIMGSMNAAVKDMEAAAIGFVCLQHQVNLIVIKAVTDFVDHPENSSEQFIRNLDLATEMLCNEVEQVIIHLQQIKN